MEEAYKEWQDIEQLKSISIMKYIAKYMKGIYNHFVI